MPGLPYARICGFRAHAREPVAGWFIWHDNRQTRCRRNF
jgi:hypothetical protein